MASRNIRSELKFLNIVLLKDSLLGIGSYGSVFKAKCDDLVCAAKILHPTLVYWDTEQSDTRHEERLPMRRFEAECQFMKDIKHPHIIQYLGLYTDPETFLPVLLMELLDESLTQFLDNREEKISPNFQITILSDVACALSYLHVNGIVHRDLSSNNILLLAKCRAKLTDFGMAKIIRYDKSNTISPGTQVYMPPESMDNAAVFTEKGDVFSLGVIIVQILTKKFPEPQERFKTIEIDHPLIPAGNVEIRVSEVERRQNHISYIEASNPLLPIALECLKNSADDRPLVTELCERFLTIKTETQGNNMEDKNEVEINHSQEDVQTLHQEIESKDQTIRSLQQDLEAAEEMIDQKDTVIANYAKELQQNQKLIFKYEKQIGALEKELERAIARNCGPTNKSKTIEPQPSSVIQQTSRYLETQGNDSSGSVCISMPLSAEDEEEQDVDYENLPSLSRADKLSRNGKEKLQSESKLEAETTPPTPPPRIDSRTHHSDTQKKTAAPHSGVNTHREIVHTKIKVSSTNERLGYQHTNLHTNLSHRTKPPASNDSKSEPPPSKPSSSRPGKRPAVPPRIKAPKGLHSGKKTLSKSEDIHSKNNVPSITNKPEPLHNTDTNVQEIHNYVNLSEASTELNSMSATTQDSHDYNNLPMAISDSEANSSNKSTQEIHDYVNLPSAGSDSDINFNASTQAGIHDYVNAPSANSEPDLNTLDTNAQQIHDYDYDYVNLPSSCTEGTPTIQNSGAIKHPVVPPRNKQGHSAVETGGGEIDTPSKNSVYTQNEKPRPPIVTEPISQEIEDKDYVNLPSASSIPKLNTLSPNSEATESDVTRCPALPSRIKTPKTRPDNDTNPAKTQNKSEYKVLVTSLPAIDSRIKLPDNEDWLYISQTRLQYSKVETMNEETSLSSFPKVQATSPKGRRTSPHISVAPDSPSGLKRQEEKADLSIKNVSNARSQPLPLPPTIHTQAEWQARSPAVPETTSTHSQPPEKERHKSDSEILSITESNLSPPAIPPRQPSRPHKMLTSSHSMPPSITDNASDKPLKTLTSLHPTRQFYSPPPQRKKKGELTLKWLRGNDAPAVMSRDTDAVVSGGMFYVRPHRTRKIYSYSPSTSKWSRQPDCSTDNATLTIIEGSLATVGGTGSKKVFTLMITDQEKTWREKYPSMNVERARCTAISIDSALVVAGGTTVTTMGPQALSSVEILNTDQKQWTLAAELPQPIYASSGGLVKGNIYLLGGLDKSLCALREMYCCSFVDLVASCRSSNLLGKISALKFSRKHSTVWTTITNSPTTEATVVTIRNKLVTIGGRDEHNTPTNAVYMYDTGGNAWSRIGELNHARAMSFTAVIHNNVILTVGGVTAIKNHGNVSIDSLEIARIT